LYLLIKGGYKVEASVGRSASCLSSLQIPFGFRDKWQVLIFMDWIIDEQLERIWIRPVPDYLCH
jgi:hypothetical protein